MKAIAATLLVLILAGCGDRQPMSEQDKALAVKLFAKPAYTPPYQVPYYPMPTYGGSSLSCSTIGGITNCH